MKWTHENPIQALSGPMAGVSLVAAVGMLTITSLPSKLMIAAICFAVALPVLSLVFVMDDAAFRKSLKTVQGFPTAYVGALLLSVVGVAITFFHLHKWAGVGFVVSSLIALAFMFVESSDG